MTVSAASTDGWRALVAGTTAAARAARAALEGDGRVTEHVPDAKSALAALEREPARVVITEWELPGELDGPGLCRALRAHPRLCGTHVVVLTSLGEEDDCATAALAAGADDYLTKPFHASELRARVGLGARAVALEASEARLLALIDNVPGAIYRCANDLDWTMELLSEEIENIVGYPVSDFIGSAVRTFASIEHPDDHEKVQRLVARSLENGEPFVIEYRLIHRDGSIRWVLERGQVVRGEHGQTWLDGAIFDITERREVEAALRAAEAEQARLEEVTASRARIVEAGYAARRRIERDLHDGAQQRLVALRLKLRVARGRLPDGEAAAAMLDEALAELDAATAELRELARGIHPAVLSDHGLGPALNGLAARAPLDVEVSADLGDRLPQAVETTAYFVATEALTNVIRHAKAQHAHMDLTRANGSAQLEVRDDGVGGAALGGGSGLRGLEDRVQAIGGSLEVECPPAGGTIVRATFPVG